MYCWSCGKEVSDQAYVCVNCGVRVDPKALLPKYHKSSFVLGILSICIPGYGFILGIIGLCLACVAKRKSAIIMNIIGIVLSVSILILVPMIQKIATANLVQTY